MRAIAAATNNPADAKAILRYADWLEAKAEVKAEQTLRRLSVDAPESEENNDPQSSG